jgi:uncharacterized protein involved in response to NO
MTTPITRTALLRSRAAPQRGTALFDMGFRPFFLGASLFATLAVPAWLLALRGGLQPGGAFGPMQWHAHEMLFGFTSAVLAGFLLTATTNWTSQQTLRGAPLAVLGAVWLLGRGAVFFAGRAPAAAAALDAAFLPLLGIACARPIFATENRRNYAFVAVLAALTVLNLGSHWAALRGDAALVRGLHLLGVDVVLLAIVIVTGRVVPSFTRNATGGASIAGQPRLERAAVALVLAIGVVDALRLVRPEALGAPACGALALGAAVVLAARMRSWGSWSARREPLLWILHLGSAWLPVGLLLRAGSLLTPWIPASAALHALTAGAIGSLTLGMMARVSLGHTGRLLAAARSTSVAFMGVAIAGVLRVLAPLLPSVQLTLLDAAGAAWSTAFGVFFVTHVRVLVSPRVDGR